MKKKMNKIIFRLFKIDRNLPREEIQEYLDLNTDDIISCIYKIALETKESSDNLDVIYDKHCSNLDITDVIEIEDNQGVSKFYILALFGFMEIEGFDKSLVNKI